MRRGVALHEQQSPKPCQCAMVNESLPQGMLKFVWVLVLVLEDENIPVHPTELDEWNL